MKKTLINKKIFISTLFVSTSILLLVLPFMNNNTSSVENVEPQTTEQNSELDVSENSSVSPFLTQQTPYYTTGKYNNFSSSSITLFAYFPSGIMSPVGQPFQAHYLMKNATTGEVVIDYVGPSCTETDPNAYSPKCESSFESSYTYKPTSLFLDNTIYQFEYNIIPSGGPDITFKAYVPGIHEASISQSSDTSISVNLKVIGRNDNSPLNNGYDSGFEGGAHLYGYFLIRNVTSGGTTTAAPIKTDFLPLVETQPSEVPALVSQTYSITGLTTGNSYQAYVSDVVSTMDLVSHPETKKTNIVKLTVGDYMTNVAISDISTNSFKVSWTWNNVEKLPIYWKADPISGNGVSAGNLEGVIDPSQWTLGVDGTSAYYVFTNAHGFKNSTLYNFSITVDNTWGDFYEFNIQTKDGITNSSEGATQYTSTITPYEADFSINWNDPYYGGTLFYKLAKVDASMNEIPILTNAVTVADGSTTVPLNVKNLTPNTNYKIYISTYDNAFQDSTHYNTINFTTNNGITDITITSSSLTNITYTIQSDYPTDPTYTTDFGYKVTSLSGSTIPGAEGSITYVPTPDHSYEYTLPSEDLLQPDSSYKLWVTDKKTSSGDWNYVGAPVETFSTKPGIQSVEVIDTTSDDATFTFVVESAEPIEIFFRVYDGTNTTIIDSGTFMPSSASQTMKLSDLGVKLQPYTTYNLHLSIDSAFRPEAGFTVQDSFQTKKYLDSLSTTNISTETATLEYTTGVTSSSVPGYVKIEGGGATVWESQVNLNPGTHTIELPEGILVPNTDYIASLSVDPAYGVDSTVTSNFRTSAGMTAMSVISYTHDSISISYDWNGQVDSTSGSGEDVIYYKITDNSDLTVTPILGQFDVSSFGYNEYTFGGLGLNKNYTIEFSHKSFDDPTNLHSYGSVTSDTSDGITSVSLASRTDTSVTLSYQSDLTVNVPAYYQLKDEVGTPIGTPVEFMTSTTNKTFSIDGLEGGETYTVDVSMYPDMRTPVSVTFTTLLASFITFDGFAQSYNDFGWSYHWTSTDAPFTFSYKILEVADSGAETLVGEGSFTPLADGTVSTHKVSQDGIILVPENKYKFTVGTDSTYVTVVTERLFSTSSRILEAEVVEVKPSSAKINYYWDDSNNTNGDVPHYSMDELTGYTPVSSSQVVDEDGIATTNGWNTIMISGLSLASEYEVYLGTTSTPISPLSVDFKTQNDYIVINENSPKSEWVELNTLQITFELDASYAGQEDMYFWITDNIAYTPPIPGTAGISTNAENPNDIENTMLNQWFSLTNVSSPNIEVNDDNILKPGEMNTVIIHNINQSINYKFTIASPTAYTNASGISWHSVNSKKLPEPFPTALVTISSILTGTIVLAGGWVVYSSKKNTKERIPTKK